MKINHCKTSKGREKKLLEMVGRGKVNSNLNTPHYISASYTSPWERLKPSLLFSCPPSTDGSLLPVTVAAAVQSALRAHAERERKRERERERERERAQR